MSYVRSRSGRQYLTILFGEESVDVLVEENGNLITSRPISRPEFDKIMATLKKVDPFRNSPHEANSFQLAPRPRNALRAEVAVIPGGIGLLYMARGLALSRGGGGVFCARWWSPATRQTARRWPSNYDISHEYYAILDRIGRGEKP
jgi:hypothetical protein